MRKTIGIALTVLALAAGAAAFAQHHGHGGHGEKTGSTAASRSTKAFEAVNAKMHKDMTIVFSGDADVDFVRGMIPHHQGAIDMAKVLLEHGKDPETRKLAGEIVAAQEKEIAWMKEWLAKKGK